MKSLVYVKNLELLDSQKEALKLQLIEKERELLLEKKRRIQSNLAFYFHPRPSQEAFFASPAPTRALFTSNRWGKTTVGTLEGIAHSLGFRPWLKPDNPLYKVKVRIPNKGIVYGTDWDKVDEVLTSNHGEEKGKFFTYAPSGSIKKALKNHRGVIDRIVWSNGSLTRFDTYESYTDNPQSAEGADYDWAMYDEPPPKGLRAAIQRGLLDRNGREWFTLTPLLQTWIYDEIFLKADGKNIWVAQGYLHDNCSTCNAPYGVLNHEALVRFEESLPEDEREARVKGRFVHLSGLVYKEFNPKRHVIPPCDIGNYTVWVAIDPHPRTPHAVLFLAVTEGGKLFLIDEIFEHCLIKELVGLIKKKLEGKSHFVTVCDPLAFIEDPVTGTTMADEFARCGLPVRKATKDRTRGILAVKKVLRDVDSEGNPQLRVFSSLRRTIFEFGHYVYDEWARRSSDKNPKEKPKDKDDHMMECLYRLILINPQFVSPTASPPIPDYDYVPTTYWGSLY